MNKSYVTITNSGTIYKLHGQLTVKINVLTDQLEHHKIVCKNIDLDNITANDEQLYAAKNGVAKQLATAKEFIRMFALAADSGSVSITRDDVAILSLLIDL